MSAQLHHIDLVHRRWTDAARRSDACWWQSISLCARSALPRPLQSACVYGSYSSVYRRAAKYKNQWSFRKTETMGTLARQAENGVWVQAPPHTTFDLAGSGCGRGSPSSAAGVRGISPGKMPNVPIQFQRKQMLGLQVCPSGIRFHCSDVPFKYVTCQ